MPKIFEDRSNFRSHNVNISGENFHHLVRVLRVAVGDEIVVTDSFGVDYNCIVNGIFPDHMTARIEDFMKNENEPELQVHLFQSMPKFDKMDIVIQKCVELGVFKIYPMKTSRTIVKTDEDGEKRKLFRWQKISESAAKQSKRGIIPEISPILGLAEAIETAQEMDLSIVLNENEEKYSLKEIDFSGKKSVAIFIGPEGGFSDEELKSFEESKALSVTLGKRVLRTETAAISALSIIHFLAENL